MAGTLADRTASIRLDLARAERFAVHIAADARLPEIRAALTDPLWRDWCGRAADMTATLGNVRALIAFAENGGEDADAALDRAERTLQILDLNRRALSDLAARWDAAAVERMTPDAKRGAAMLSGASRGHTSVYGTCAEKRARWTQQAEDYQKEIERGTGRDATYFVVAEKHGVSDRTIRRAVRRFAQIA